MFPLTQPFKTWIIPIAAFFLLHAGYSLSGADPDADFDRLDGLGKSGKKVDVVEWEGNLEIHVYPAGSLAGLSLKLDKRNKDKPVMVIGYRFTNDPKTTLIRRAILGVPFQEGFQAFKDPSADDYDKVVISNNGLPKPMIAFKLDIEPKQLYPDGHPALEERMPASKAVSKEKDPPTVPLVDEETGTIRPFMMEKEVIGRDGR